ncbi:MAG: PA0069 family radical SAM protein [Alphaproteobacteria bacterium]|nr:PA0069 family radical SAM protein [Alphaproteobacteria bacterium]
MALRTPTTSATPAGTAVHPDGRRGRGAISNASGRFERERRLLGDAHFRFDDDWGAADTPPPPLRTSVTIDRTRTIITTNDSPDVGFDQSINAYRGCEHGCIYCFARPTHAYLGLSPGLDFESKLFAKPDAARLLAGELRRPGYRCKVIAIGTNTDPYQPLEREMRITRDILQVLAAFRHPVGIVTKSALVVRDLDVLAVLAEQQLVKVMVSVTTLDHRLARHMEPRASTPHKRLAAVRALAHAGVPVGLTVAPVIPALNDHEIEPILAAAHAAGAVSASYVLLRLPHEIKDLFQEWLRENVPDRADRILRHLREARGGKLYDARFGLRGRGEGPYANMIGTRFRLACRKLGLNRTSLALRTDRFMPPAAAGDQLNFL